MFQFTELSLRDAKLFMEGTAWTLVVFVSAMALGSSLGLILALIRHARVKILATLVVVFVESLRNSPVLVQLFLVFFGLPMVVGTYWDPLPAAIFTLSLNTAAFMTVNFLAALEAIPTGQWQAAMAFGLRYPQILRHVVLPQAIRMVIPPGASLAVGQLQVTALVSIINVLDLAKVGSILNTRTLSPFLIWPLVAAVYWALSKALSLLAAWLERKTRLPGAWTPR